MNGMKWLAAGLLVAVLTGCGAGKTLVLEPSTEAGFKASSVVVQVEKASVKVPSEVESKFQTSLAQELYGQNGFTEGKALILRYRFIGFQPGNQFKRWMMGGLGNSGEASLTVQVEFFDGQQKLSKIQVEGKISSGLFGGSFDNAINKAAHQAASYAIQQYRQ